MEMKKLTIFTFIVVTFLVTEESFSQNTVSISAPIKPQYGYLLISTYSYKENDEFGQTNRLKFKPYEIYSEENKLILNVPAYYYNPERVRLKEGIYLIQAEMEQGKIYYYRVKIEAGKLTEIDGEILKSSDYTYN
jgi:hypothetical protein